MMYVIYRVTHKESGKIYIGKHQTLNINDGYMGSGKLIRRAVKKYGIEAFDKEILHIFETEVEMNTKEAELVTEEFCLYENTYNLCPGGQGGWGYVNSLPLLPSIREGRRKGGSITAKKLAARHQELLNQPGYRDHWIASQLGKQTWLGKSHTEETRAKMKISHSGKHAGEKNSQFGTCWITNGIDNKKISKSDLDQYPDWVRGRKIS